MIKKLQVFISSTYTDLIDERQTTVQAILDAGHIPAGMELFKAGNVSQLKTIYKWIDESDVYMLILGGRYGTIEKKSDKSYTQLEYEYALFKNIPVFSVVLSESYLTNKINLLGLSDVIEQKAPDKYQAFKSLVMSKIVREVDDYKDIKIAVLTTLSEFLNDYNLDGWVRNNNEYDILKLLKENNLLHKQIQEMKKQFENKIQHQFGNYTFDELLYILKNKSYTFTLGNSTVKATVNTLDFFISNYSAFASLTPNKEIFFHYASTGYYKVLRFLESYNLIREQKGIINSVTTFSITKTGNIFYTMLESNNLTRY